MSLYETFYEKCVIMNKMKVLDGEGGMINTYTPGAEFNAAFPELSPTAQLVAQQAAAQYTGTITTPANVTLDEQDVFQRTASGEYYLVVAPLPAAPGVATFQFARYSVRELAALP